MFIIVSFVRWKLARFLCYSLAHLTKNNLYTIKNSYDFLHKLIFLLNCTMLSLDVKSLFTNVRIRGSWVIWKKDYASFIAQLLKLWKFWVSLIYALSKLTLFSIVFLFPDAGSGYKKSTFSLTLVFNWLLKSKTMTLFLFLMCWWLNIKIDFQQLFSRYPSQFLFHFMLSPIILFNWKLLFSVLMLFVLCAQYQTHLIFQIKLIT